MAKESIKHFIVKDEHGKVYQQDSFSVVGEVEVNLDGGVGEPSAESEYADGKLTITLHNLKGEGISDISYTPSEEDGGENLLTITTDAGHTYSFVILNGSKGEQGNRGNGIASIETTESTEDGGINTVTITDDDGNTKTFSIRNGTQGDSVIVGEGDLPLTHVLGNSTEKAISQKGVTEAITVDNAYEFVDIPLTLANSTGTRNYISSVSAKWVAAIETSSNIGRVFKIKPGKRYRIVARQDASSAAYAWLQTSAAAAGTDPDFAGGMTNVDFAIKNGQTYYMQAPADAEYLYLSYRSGNSDVLPQSLDEIVTVKDKISKMGDYGYREVSEIDLSILSEQDCSLGTTAWFLSRTLKNQKHVAVPVNPGETYKIKANKKVALVAVLTSAYNPPYESGDPLPLASNNAERIMVYGTTYITIPSDGAYLAVTTVDGSGTVSEIDVWKAEKSENLTKTSPVKLRVMQWNVGHWAMGASPIPLLTPQEFEAKKIDYHRMLNEASADLICCCEWSEYVDNESSGRAKDEVFSNYEQWRQGNKPDVSYNSYMQTCQLFNGLECVYVEQKAFTQSVSGVQYFQTVTYRINGHDVKVVATHLNWNQGEHGAEYRQSQMEELIDTFADAQYVIICADYNVHDSLEYDVFAAAGYEMANHGYLGDLITGRGIIEDSGMPKYLDNIICKGFKIGQIAVYDEDFELSDHCAIAATLTMID